MKGKALKKEACHVPVTEKSPVRHLYSVCVAGKGQSSRDDVRDERGQVRQGHGKDSSSHGRLLISFKQGNDLIFVFVKDLRR